MGADEHGARAEVTVRAVTGAGRGPERRGRAGGVVGLVFFAACLSCAQPAQLERHWSVMGTRAGAQVQARTERTAAQALEQIARALERADAALSNWREDSALAEINRRAASGAYTIDDLDVYRCLKLALDYARATGGAFDPTVGPLLRLYGFRPRAPRQPEPREIQAVLEHVGWRKVELLPATHTIRFRDPRVELDLGGIGKGCALDVAARAFSYPGVLAGLIEVGGSVLVWGAPAGAPSWSVAVRDPWDPQGRMGVLRLAHRAVASSSNLDQAIEVAGQRLGHILDPGTGRPAASDVIAATVVADSGADADALSTAFYVAGSKRVGEWLKRAIRVEALLLVARDEGPELLASASLRERFELDPAFAEKIGGRLRFILPPETIDGQRWRDLDPWERLLD